MLKEKPTEVPCEYCGENTGNWIELGRGIHLKKILCCPACFERVDALPQRRKDEMAEAAFVLTMVGDTDE